MRADRLTSAAPTLAAVLIAGLLAVPALADDIKLTETGSTLLYPLFNVWVSEYTKTHPGVTISTAGTGSGVGLDQALSGGVQIGASDAYMSDQQARRNPQIVDIPMAISALTVNYNIPGLGSNSLKLDGPTLSDIYTGKVKMWDDGEIAGLNPGVKLPHQTIIPVRRSDASGDTFVFTQYLTFSTPSWEDNIGYGTTVNWPAVSGSLTAEGNDGVLKSVQQTPYSLTYVGVSYHADVDKAALGTAALKSYSGEFLLPTPDTIAAAAASLGPRTPVDERLTLVNAPGANAYPMVNYEYAIVSTKQANPDVATAMRRFLHWASAPDETNQKYLDDAHFIALPPHVWVLTYDQIEAIQ
ncbi:phosphate ABC transporter substrate-binding protein PstS [Labrys okinawensis]|uniref:phosphate ABC transporter substrate-binding protein PstS n=1 Tax=Labrys okinawensis TaxID=346911 RepID=UPI0039BD2F9C